MISLIVFTVSTHIITIDRLITIILSLYILTVLIVSNSNSKVSKFLGFDSNDSYYKTYLNVIINTLQITDKHIDQVIEIGTPSDYRVKDSVLQINGCLSYLKTINPPKQYEENHNSILRELESFLMEYAI